MVSSAQDLAQGVRLSVTRLARRLRKEADTGISPSMLSALSTIDRAPAPLTIGELAAAEGVRPPSATAVVGRLLEAGLVTRDADPEDGRVYRLGLTRDGARLLERSRSRKTAYLAKKLGGLSEEEREALAEAVPLLDRLLEQGP
ncbi:MAG: MarR family transcriptional regulator [Actinomycetota bacterium]